MLALELLGQLGLADLALEAAVAVARVQVADELHGDRRAALHGRARLEVLQAGAQDALVVDAPVLVEALVLDRDRGLLHRRGDDRELDWRAQLVGRDEAEALAVGGVDHRGLAVVDRLERVDRRGRGGDADDVADQAEDADEAGDDADAEGDQEALAEPTVALLAALLSLSAAHARSNTRGRPRWMRGRRRRGF